MISSKRQRLTGTILMAALSIGLLSGCADLPFSAAKASPSPTPTPSKTSVITTIHNDLAAGSTKRLLGAGAIALTVNYWSDLAMDQWTASANKPISFSMVGTIDGDQGQAVYLSEVSAVLAVNGPDGPLTAPAPLDDRATITPGYLVKSPYSYSQTFVLPALDNRATSVTLSFTYQLLLQTTPTSSEYAKQTASDSLTVAIAQP
ncbi:MAG TPA: hypothetical protein VGC18_05095 [Lacisediminihabitans sp.]|uniref:hypothetical protein n=1 Tax=Lacisediminihabitans sp. TaxID=2787631 RepID=UPI002ED82DC2